MTGIAIALLFICGVIIGIVKGFALDRKSCIGTIRIDRSDPYDPPYIFLELTEDLNSVESKRYAFVRISNKNYTSQH